jgi:hypothetical protein
MVYLLEIHHIGISGGDATLILVRRYGIGEPQIVCKVLIDAGGESYGKGYATLKGYLADFGTQPFDYIIASHYHADHIAGFALSGISFKRFIDMGGYATGNNRFDPINPIGDLSHESGTVEQYQYYVHSQVKNQDSRVELPFLRKENFNDQGVLDPRRAGPVKIELVSGSGIWLTCYCAGGVLADGTNALRASVTRRILRQFTILDNELNTSGKQAQAAGTDLTEAHFVDASRRNLTRIINDEMAKASPNDLSLAFILEWGDFRYFTAGDLSGDLSLTRYANIEEPLITYLRSQQQLTAHGKPITVMKATHHGSNHNNYPAEMRRVLKDRAASANEDDDDNNTGDGATLFRSARRQGLLDELGPTTIIVSANQMKGVPGGEFIGRVQEYCTERNQALGLIPNVIDDLKSMKFHEVWQKYQNLANDMGPDSRPAMQLPLLKRLTTIAFVNEMRYPRPPKSYDSKQKADWGQLFDLARAVPRTNIDARNRRADGSQPRAVIVYYPVPEQISFIPPTSELIAKSSHLVAIDGRSRQTSKTTRGSTSPQLENLIGTMRDSVMGDLQHQLDFLNTMIAKDAEKGQHEGIEFAARNYPSLISGTGRQRQLNPAVATLAALQRLLARAYPAADEYFTFWPHVSDLTFNERRTVVVLVWQTPSGNDDGYNILGQMPFTLPYKLKRRQRASDLKQRPVKRQRRGSRKEIDYDES